MWSTTIPLGGGNITECMNWIRGVCHVPFLATHLPALIPEETEVKFIAHQLKPDSQIASSRSIKQKCPCVNGMYAIDGPVGIMAERFSLFVYLLGMGSPVMRFARSLLRSKTRPCAYFSTDSFSFGLVGPCPVHRSYGKGSSSRNESGLVSIL